MKSLTPVWEYLVGAFSNFISFVQQDWLFLVISLVVVLMALLAVACRDLTRSALALLACFGGIALLYFSLGAYFIAIAQILVYAVGITLIILFAIMLVRDTSDGYTPENSERRNMFLITSGVVSILVFLAFAVGIWNSSEEIFVLSDLIANVKAQVNFGEPSIIQLGYTLIREQLLAFELISVLLLVAFVSAIVLANRQKKVS